MKIWYHRFRPLDIRVQLVRSSSQYGLNGVFKSLVWSSDFCSLVGLEGHIIVNWFRCDNLAVCLTNHISISPQRLQLLFWFWTSNHIRHGRSQRRISSFTCLIRDISSIALLVVFSVSLTTLSFHWHSVQVFKVYVKEGHRGDGYKMFEVKNFVKSLAQFLHCWFLLAHFRW